MSECSCDVCSLLEWLRSRAEGDSGRAASALVQALWAVIQKAEGDDESAFHRSVLGEGLDPHTFVMLRTAAKLASWELQEAPEGEEEPVDDEVAGEALLH